MAVARVTANERDAPNSGSELTKAADAPNSCKDSVSGSHDPLDKVLGRPWVKF